MQESEAPPLPPSPPRKSRVWLWITVVVVVLVGAGAGGTVAGAKLLRKPHPKAAAKVLAEPEVEVMSETVPLEEIVVDIRSKEGSLHHLKVGVSVELKEGTELAQAKLCVPRGREAVIFYLRSKTFEELTEPGGFSKVIDELNKKVIAAFGRKRAKRILVTDYLSQ